MLKAELNPTRLLGCEFEFYLPKLGATSGDSVQQTLAQILTANGLRSSARSYSHAPFSGDLCIESDASINGSWANINGVPYAPIEMKTRILTYDEWEQIVPKALSIIGEFSGRVNQTTGMHIHLGFPEIQTDPNHIRSLFNLFFRYEPVIFGLLAPSRLNNQYCRAIPLNSYNLFQGCRAERSYIRAVGQLHNKNGLNFSNILNGNQFASKPHIEIRYHHGSLDTEKIRNFLRFCLQMVQHACKRTCQSSPKQIQNDRIGLERMLVSCGFKVNNNVYAEVCPELRETGKYLIQRWKKFNGDVSLASCKKAVKK